VAKNVKAKPGQKPAKRVLHAAEPPGRWPDHLTWRVAQVDFGGEWGWGRFGQMDVADRLRLQQELVAFENEPLAVLKQRRWVKLIPPKDMNHAAWSRLQEIGRDDPDGLWQLHLAHKKWRVWGFLEGSCFYILWWDPHHSVATGKCRTRKT